MWLGVGPPLGALLPSPNVQSYRTTLPSWSLDADPSNLDAEPGGAVAPANAATGP